MQFMIVDPRKRTVEAFDGELDGAKVAAGLDPHAVDHGTIAPGLAVVVYEYSLYVPPHKQAYCGVNGTLVAGPAVFYRYDQHGETVDLWKSEFPDVRFYLGINDVEAAFERGEIARPFTAVNDNVIWQFNKGANPWA